MKPRILTILGTRPEIIRLSRIMPKLDALCDHRVVYTGQNYDANLSDVFFHELGLRAPDQVLAARGSLAQQLSVIYQGIESFIDKWRPDRVLILGDTTSALCAVVCERMGVPVYHMEAGNRCYDRRVPEEINRRMIDSISTVNLPYTELSRQNLLREGAANHTVMVTGNPIREVIEHYHDAIQASQIMHHRHLQPGGYAVATVHRAENVEHAASLDGIMQALITLSDRMPVVFSCHPRTRQKLQSRQLPPHIQVLEPLGLFDWLHLCQHSVMAITDSGTVQEEMCLFGRPTVTVRHSTERPETVWCGSNIVAGVTTDTILTAIDCVLTRASTWQIPPEYARTDVSDTVINILLSVRN